jgi:septal ring factor EnvC (AmiA/AmiB activator)
MEGHLHVVDSIKAQVTALEESTGELGAQHDTLSSVVERIDLAQTRLTAAADRAATESRQQTPPPDRHYQGSRRRQGRDEDDGGEDIIPTTHKPGARGTSQSAGRRNRNASPWPLAIFSMTHNSGFIGWSSMGAVHPGHNSSNW